MLENSLVGQWKPFQGGGIDLKMLLVEKAREGPRATLLSSLLHGNLST